MTDTAQDRSAVPVEDTATDRPVDARRARLLAFVTLLVVLAIPIVVASQIGA